MEGVKHVLEFCFAKRFVALRAAALTRFSPPSSRILLRKTLRYTSRRGSHAVLTTPQQFQSQPYISQKTFAFNPQMFPSCCGNFPFFIKIQNKKHSHESTHNQQHNITQTSLNWQLNLDVFCCIIFRYKFENNCFILLYSKGMGIIWILSVR